MSIVLKDHNNANVTYTLRDRRSGTAIFMAPGSTLAGRSRLTLSIVERDKTNRVVGKLEIPSILECPDSCQPATVAYTEIGSFDLSAVKFASADDAADFIAQFQSLVSTAAVASMYTDGILPE